jgi:hypothetical protein
VVGVMLLLLTAAGCTSPSHTDEDFRRKAVESLKQAAGAVGTAEYAALLAERDDAFDPYLAVLTGDARTTGESVRDTFTAVTPPTGRAEQLGTEVGALLRRTADALAAADEAAGQGPEALAAERATLEDVDGRLEELQGRLG